MNLTEFGIKKLRLTTIEIVERLIRGGKANSQKQAIELILKKSQKANCSCGFTGDLHHVYRQYIEFKKKYGNQLKCL